VSTLMHLSHLGMSKNFVALDIVLLRLQPFTDLCAYALLWNLVKMCQMHQCVQELCPKTMILHWNR
jgi:hypothetical protein